MMSDPSLVTLDRLAPTAASLGADARVVFRRLSAAGFRDVQLSARQPGLRPRELDASGRRDLLATLRRAGLAVSGLDAFAALGQWRDPATVDEVVDLLSTAIAMAADLGRVPISVALPSTEETGEAVAAVVAIAERHGVMLADHATHDAAGAGPWHGVGIDPVASLARGDDPAVEVMSATGRIASARAADLFTSGRRGPLGDPAEGQLDVLAYRVALSVSGYERPVVLDTRQWTDPWSGLESSRNAWCAVGTP